MQCYRHPLRSVLTSGGCYRAISIWADCEARVQLVGLLVKVHWWPIVIFSPFLPCKLDIEVVLGLLHVYHGCGSRKAREQH